MADPNGADLAFALALKPQAAIDHLAGKGLMVSQGWRSVKPEQHARAFTVANVTQADVVGDIRQELLRAQAQGLSLEQFKANLQPMLERKGWFAGRGEPARVPDGGAPDPATGELPTRKRLTARRLQTIYQTNMQSSMMAARWRELKASADLRPWFQYVAILDGRTRPAHRAMHGRVMRHDDAGWAFYWPPCGWNCRCRVRALADQDLADRGLQPQPTEGRSTETSVPLPDGSVSTTHRLNLGGGRSFAPDPGFDSNPALVQAADRLLVQRAHEALPDSNAAQSAVNRVFTHPQRRQALQAFVADARQAQGRTVGAKFGVGALDDAAVLRLADEGEHIDQAAPITVSDHLAAQSVDDKLPAAELWAQVPEAIAHGKLYWDAANTGLVYVTRWDLQRWLHVDVVGNEVAGIALQDATALKGLQALKRGGTAP